MRTPLLVIGTLASVVTAIVLVWSLCRQIRRERAQDAESKRARLMAHLIVIPSSGDEEPGRAIRITNRGPADAYDIHFEASCLTITGHRVPPRLGPGGEDPRDLRAGEDWDVQIEPPPNHAELESLDVALIWRDGQGVQRLTIGLTQWQEPRMPPSL